VNFKNNKAGNDMQESLIHIGLAFVEGFALIISPCILPILPIILAGSFTGNRARPIGIVTGFIITFALFTLFSRTLIQYATIEMITLRNISFWILLILGIIMISPKLTEILGRLTQPLARVGNSFNTQGGFYSGLLFGGLVGLIWTPCAGPVLAAVIVQVVLQKTTLDSILVVFAFAIGAGIPMLLIAWFGRGIMGRFSFFRTRAEFLRKLLGFILIIAVLYFWLSPGFVITQNQKNVVVTTHAEKLVNGISTPYMAPEIQGITSWINSPPLTLNSLKGKVVLVDFWTYSCINCIRTLPYLRDWYAKYHDKGFEIIGVHSPEFQFEHDVNNVKQAVKADDITWPVALDNDFVTWRNFQNEYWPAHYLINKEGVIVYVHLGEGEYDVTENNIRFLLGVTEGKANNQTEEDYSFIQTPETYLGYRRGERFASPEGVTKDVLALYQYPEKLERNEWALRGSFIISSEKIVSASPDASIKLHFRGSKVYIVMGSTKKQLTLKVLLNDKPLIEDKGQDVVNSQILVNRNRLYYVVNLKQGNEGILEIIAKEPGLEVYTFTFG